MPILSELIQTLDAQFQAKQPIYRILRNFSRGIDDIIMGNLPDNFKARIVAIGGYGRCEMYPYSDVDLLIIPTESTSEQTQRNIQRLIQFLWDKGLKVSHSIRTMRQIEQDAPKDPHLFTALLESRVLYGDERELKKVISSLSNIKPYHQDGFLSVKLHEQDQRHEKFDDNLEPDLKQTRGGLRDIHHLNWLATFYREDLSRPYEHRQIRRAFNFLAKLRICLHLKYRKNQNVLTFEDQKALAEEYGFENKPGKLAVESFMQVLYRHLECISFYNELLNQAYKELFLDKGAVTKINNDFENHDHLLGLTEPDRLRKNPRAIFDAFNLMCEQPDFSGFTSDLIRALHQSRRYINTRFREDPSNIAAFLKLLEQPIGVARQFERLNRYDLLSAFIPMIDDVKGQMQFDLFHRKTVDQHTIATIKECRKIFHGLYEEELPLATQVIKELPSMRLLILAALFHDIGKGRGVDHSEWGADAAYDFCQQANLNQAEAALVSFLVKQHLTLSLTAQKMDIMDVKVIKQFTDIVDSKLKLKYLYILTVADIRATNMTLWSGWKSSLLDNLYRTASHYIDHDVIESTSMPEDCLAHLREMDKEKPPVVKTSHHPKHRQLECLLYARREDFIFAKITAIIDSLNLYIAQAYVYNTEDNHVLYNLVILNAENNSPTRTQAKELSKELLSALKSGRKVTISKRRHTRKRGVFDVKTHIVFDRITSTQHTMLELSTLDKAGLIADIAKIFAEHNTLLKQAKIATLGEQAEDTFFITTTDFKPIDQTSKNALTKALSSL